MDNDGHLDLYVTNWGSNFLFRNRGDGTFEEVAAQAGVAAGGWSTGCTFFDADADGDLDLYVARYVETTWDSVVRAQRTLVWRNGPRIMVGPAGLPGEADLFFENLGNGRFSEATEAHGTLRSRARLRLRRRRDRLRRRRAVDLFVANDSNPNFLYHNLGNGRFESAGLLAGVAVNAEGRAQAGMGADAGDYDGDGRIDLVLTAFAHDNNSLYRNVDGRQFEDASAASGLAARDVRAHGLGRRPSSTPISTAGWICSSPTATSSRTSTSIPQLGETSARRTSCCSTRAGGSATSRRARAVACRSRASAAASRSETSTTTATSMSS